MNVSQVSQSLSHLVSAFAKAERWCDKQRREACSLPLRQAASRRRGQLRRHRIVVREVLQQSDRGQLDTYLPWAPISEVDRAVSRLIRSDAHSVSQLDQAVVSFERSMLESVETLQRAAENTLAVAIFDPLAEHLRRVSPERPCTHRATTEGAVPWAAGSRLRKESAHEQPIDFRRTGPPGFHRGTIER